MSDVANVVRGFRVKQKEVEFAQEKLVELTRRSDDVRENLPKLERAVASARQHRDLTADRFVLQECSEAEFIKASEVLEKAEKGLENERLINDAILRQIKKIEGELPRLHTQVQIAERKVWETISAEFESQISDDIKETVTTIVAIGCQIGRTRQFILDCLFPNPSSGETQEVQKGLREEYSLID